MEVRLLQIERLQECTLFFFLSWRSCMCKADHGTTSYFSGHESSFSGQKCAREWEESSLDFIFWRCVDQDETYEFKSKPKG